jgi:N4-gp56 family major capsid protein
MKKPLPANSGTVAYFPRMTNSSTTVSAYKIQYSAGYGPISTEAVVAANVSATVEQFGNAKAITDVTKLTAINSTVEEAVREIGDQAGVILDSRILQEAYGTSAAPTGAGFSSFAYNTVGKADLGASTSAYGTYAGTVEYGMTADTLRKSVKKLMARNVKPFDDGLYAFVMHTNSAFAIQADTAWQTAYGMLILVCLVGNYMKKIYLNSGNALKKVNPDPSQIGGSNDYEQTKILELNPWYGVGRRLCLSA